MSTEEEPEPAATPDEEPSGGQEWLGGFSAEPIYEPPKHFGSEPTITGWFEHPGVLPERPAEEPETAPITQAEPEPEPITQAEPEPEPIAQAEPETPPITRAEPETAPITRAEPETAPIAQAEPESRTDEPSESDYLVAGEAEPEPEPEPVEEEPEWAPSGGWYTGPETGPLDQVPDDGVPAEERDPFEQPAAGEAGWAAGDGADEEREAEAPEAEEPPAKPAIGSDWPLRSASRPREGWQEEPWTGPAPDLPEEFGTAAYMPPEDPATHDRPAYGSPAEPGRPEDESGTTAYPASEAPDRPVYGSLAEPGSSAYPPSEAPDRSAYGSPAESDRPEDEFGSSAYPPPDAPDRPAYGSPAAGRSEDEFGTAAPPEAPDRPVYGSLAEPGASAEPRSGPRHGRRAGAVRDEGGATNALPAARPSRRRAKKRSGAATVFAVLAAVLGTLWMVFAFVGRPVLRFLRQVSSDETRPRWMTRLPGNRFALAALIALAVAALYGVASFARPAASETAGATRVPPPSAAAVCPDPSEARVSAVTSPGARGAGRIEVAGGPPATLTSPGTAWSAMAKKGSGAWTFGAAGSLASGLTVEQTSGHGDLAGVRCDEPAADQWFMGPGPAQVRDVALTLTNADDRPVSVGVEGLSDDGSIETVDGHDIAIGGHTTRLIHVGQEPDGLGTVAAGVKLIALHVHAINGRIAAAVRVERKKGADWLPATRPGTSLVVPGVASGKGARRLLVAVPGRDEASVEVEVMSPDGTSVPAGQRVLQAAALAVTPLDLGLGGKPAGIRLVSDHPIVAALVAEQDTDFAATAAVPPLGAGGLVAENKDHSTLLLTAPGDAAVVRVTQIMAHGPASTGQDVRVPAGRTVEVSMPPPAGAPGYALSVVPKPGSGPVYAARSLKIKGQGITVLPIAPARTTVVLPPVADVPLP